MLWLWNIIQAIIVGGLIGALARLILPGRQNISVGTTILAGVLASLVGTIIARILNVSDTRGIDWIELIIQVVLAVVFVSFAARRFPARAHPATATGPTNYGTTNQGTTNYGSTNTNTYTNPAGTPTMPSTPHMPNMPSTPNMPANPTYPTEPPVAPPPPSNPAT